MPSPQAADTERQPDLHWRRPRPTPPPARELDRAAPSIRLIETVFALTFLLTAGCSRAPPARWHSQTLGPLSWESHEALIEADAIHQAWGLPALLSDGHRLRITISYAFHGCVVITGDLDSGATTTITGDVHAPTHSSDSLLSNRQRQQTLQIIDDLALTNEPKAFLDGYYVVIEFTSNHTRLTTADQCPRGRKLDLLRLVYQATGLTDEGYGIVSD